MLEQTGNLNLADHYFEMLRNLSSDIKLDLIAKLSQSIKKAGKEQQVSLESLYGAFKSDKSAEDIIAELRTSRTFNRNTESL